MRSSVISCSVYSSFSDRSHWFCCLLWSQ